MTPLLPKPKPAADPVQRFATDLAAEAGAAAVDQDRFGIAVSGGPDSMALLWLAHNVLGRRCLAATIDHGLRPESSDEAAMVAKYCAGQGIEHIILAPETPIIGSLQAAARGARYALLDAWQTQAKIDWLLTAHHADDQLETLLMRLNRSSGVGGLAGIRARNGRIIRPLLAWPHAQLVALCHDRDLPFCLDPSNEDERYDRVRMRKSLADADWPGLDRSAPPQCCRSSCAGERARRRCARLQTRRATSGGRLECETLFGAWAWLGSGWGGALLRGPATPVGRVHVHVHAPSLPLLHDAHACQVHVRGTVGCRRGSTQAVQHRRQQRRKRCAISPSVQDCADGAVLHETHERRRFSAPLTVLSHRACPAPGVSTGAQALAAASVERRSLSVRRWCGRWGGSSGGRAQPTCPPT